MTYGKAVNALVDAGLLDQADARKAITVLGASSVEMTYPAWAEALVRAGLPAVIAHQCPLPDTSAVLFAAEFYRALADGLPVDAAVCEGRKALLSELGTSRWDRVDWAAPVLFMRGDAGALFSE